MTVINGHINQALTNFSVGIVKKPSTLIATTVAPVVNVQNQSDSYFIWDAAALRIPSTVHAPRSLVSRIVRTESDDTYLCKEFAVEDQIPWARLANANAVIREEQRSTAVLVSELLLRREKAVADVMFGALFTHTAALAAADRWDVDTSFPCAKVNDAMETIRALIGVEPNAVVMGAHVWAHLRQHPDITQKIVGMVGGQPATEAQAATALGVDRIIVGRAMYVTSAEGITPLVKADIWGKFASVCYIDPAASSDIEGLITPMSSFVWSGVAAPFSTFTYEEEQSRSHVVQAYDCVDAKAISVDSAYLYSTVVS
jgi:hypothetical protein